MTTEPDKPVSVRIPIEVLEKIDEMAEREHRSRHGQILAMLREFLDASGAVMRVAEVDKSKRPEWQKVEKVVKVEGKRVISGEVIEKKSGSAGGGHDPVTCRIYRCGMCLAARGGK
jgi:hypothetical protein